MSADLATVLGSQETVTLEFKRVVDLAVIRKAICAFANDLGGRGAVTSSSVWRTTARRWRESTPLIGR